MNNQEPIPARMTELIELLLRKTENRVVQWKRTDHPDTFTSRFNSGFVNVRSVSDATGLLRYRLSVFSPKGEETQQWTTLPAGSSFTDAHRHYADRRLENLYSAAQKAAFDHDETVEGILKELEGGW